jgi:DNA-binding CsgD family transcriptional regulator
MRKAARNLVQLVEAAYRLDVDRQQWLEGLAGVLGTMGGAAHGLMVYEYDASRPDDGVDIPAYALYELGEEFARATIVHNKASSPEDTRRVYHSGVRCGTVSEIFSQTGRELHEQEKFKAAISRVDGMEDAWGLSASNPDGRGVGIAAPLYEVTSMSASMRELWGLVGVHLAAAYRLRRGGDADENQPEAVFAPDGRLVRADGIGFDEKQAERTSEAVRRFERARSPKIRRNPEQALRLWKGLIDGRWSLVEHTEEDGSRLLFVHKNDPQIDGPSILTERERKVAAYAAQGDPVERIAYALGLDEQEVVDALESVMNTLDLGSREQLAAYLREFVDD